MDEKLDVTGLSVDGNACALSRGVLRLHPVGLSWGLDLETDDLGLRGHRSGDSLELEMETSEGLLAGTAKVLRVMEMGNTASIEMFGDSDLVLGEDVFRAQYV